MDLMRCYKKVDDILAKQAGEDFYLIDRYRRKFIQINPVGLEIWQLLDGKHKISELVDCLKDKFDVDEKDLKRDIVNFVSDLERRELVL